MTSITHAKRYCPHEITTKVYSVQLYRQTKDVAFVCRRYHISKASLMRWNKLYDGTRESLEPKSHRPRTPHPNAHTAEELKWIQNLHKRNPHISICEMYGKLLERGYTRHIGSLYRVFVRLGYREWGKPLMFYPYKDLLTQMQQYLYHSNCIPMSALKWKSPIQKRQDNPSPRACLFLQFS